MLTLLIAGSFIGITLLTLALYRRAPVLPDCQVCGEPSSSAICVACRKGDV